IPVGFAEARLVGFLWECEVAEFDAVGPAQGLEQVAVERQLEVFPFAGFPSLVGVGLAVARLVVEHAPPAGCLFDIDAVDAAAEEHRCAIDVNRRGPRLWLPLGLEYGPAFA